MLQPLKQFYCDTCNNIIEKPEDGRVEWLTENIEGNKVNYSFRIFHHLSDCQFLLNKGKRKELSLDSFLGAKGTIKMLSFIDIGVTFDNANGYCGPFIKNFREYVEFFRRLSIPYYEEARIYWQQAGDEGEHIGINENLLYLPDRLKKLIEKYQNI